MPGTHVYSVHFYGYLPHKGLSAHLLDVASSAVTGALWHRARWAQLHLTPGPNDQLWV